MNIFEGPKTQKQRRRLDPLKQFMDEFSNEGPAMVLTLKKSPNHPKEAHELCQFPTNELK